MNLPKLILLATTFPFIPPSCEKKQSISPAITVSIDRDARDSVGVGTMLTDARGAFVISARSNFMVKGEYAVMYTVDGQMITQQITAIDDNYASEVCVCLLGQKPVELKAQPLSSTLRGILDTRIAKDIRPIENRKRVDFTTHATHSAVVEIRNLPQPVECVDTGRSSLPVGTGLIPQSERVFWILGDDAPRELHDASNGQRLSLCFGLGWTTIQETRKALLDAGK